MKSLFFCVLGAGLLAASGAFADDHHNNGNGNHEQHPAKTEASHHESHTSSHERVRESEPRHVTEHRTEHREVEHRDVHRDVTVHRNVSVHRNVTVRGHANVAVRGRVNLAHFHRAFRAPHRFHIRAWNAPRGFAYRRFGIGERIPAVLLVADFFLTDYAAYGLEYPGDEYVWVRDGDDAVLVDRYTGEVIEVEYGVFY